MILAINTASSWTTVLLTEVGDIEQPQKSYRYEPVSAENFQAWPSQNDQAEKLMPTIDELLKQQNAQYQDIKKIYCISGPGSFTGLRVGVTVANTIAYLTGVELFAINTLEFWHHNRENICPIADAAILVFAGRGAVYLQLPPENAESQLPDPHLLNLEDLPAAFAKHKITQIYGDISPDQRQKILDSSTTNGPLQFHDHQDQWPLFIQTAITKHPGAPTPIIKPNYIKAPNISKAKSKI
jgi:tRNA threonylcarbamoyl adenosine modification protein YeaZ